MKAASRARLDTAMPASLGGLKVTGKDVSDGYKFNLEDGGWLLVRFSGTEPLIRVYTETMHREKVAGILEDGLRVAGLK
jgi:phosphomannomutase